MTTNAQIRNAQRYAKQHGFTLESIHGDTVELVKDSASHYMTHEQIRASIYPEPPHGATHRGEKWHYYKCDGRIWKVWKEGIGWAHIAKMPSYLICLESHEVLPFA